MQEMDIFSKMPFFSNCCNLTGSPKALKLYILLKESNYPLLVYNRKKHSELAKQRRISQLKQFQNEKIIKIRLSPLRAQPMIKKKNTKGV